MLVSWLMALAAQAPLMEAAAPPPLLAVEPDAPRRTGVDLLLGSPLGLALRVQHRPLNWPLYIEGYLGTFLFGSGGGLGVRGEYANVVGNCDTLLMRPGVTAYAISLSEFISSSSSAGVLAVDVDLAWQHRFSWGGVGELGLKVGPGIAFERRDAELIGVFSVYYGWRF